MTITVCTDAVVAALHAAVDTLHTRPWVQGRPALPYGAAYALDGAIAVNLPGMEVHDDGVIDGEPRAWVLFDDATGYCCRALAGGRCGHDTTAQCRWAMQEWHDQPDRTRNEVLAVARAAHDAAYAEWIGGAA